MRMTRILLPLLLGTAPGALSAQATGPAAPTDQPTATPAGTEAGATEQSDEEEGTITVTGQRPPGSAIGNVPAEVTLGVGDIRSYGVSSVTDLLNELTPQTTSGRGGAPVVLLNGRRISGFGEIRDLPTEAIIRIDILPEEVALKYGYTADQKVVNFVLRPRFRALTTELTGSTSTEGGGETGRIEASALRINRAGRTTLSVDYRKNGSLLESDRGIVSAALRQPFDVAGNVSGIPLGTEIDPALSAIAGTGVTLAGVPAGAASGRVSIADFAATANRANVTDVRDFRTLRAATDQLTVNSVLARTIFGDIPITFNGTFGATGSDGLRGLAGATLQVPAGNPYSPFARAVNLYRYLPDQPLLTQSVAGNTAHAGVTANGEIGKWRWTFTGNYDRALTRTATANGIDISAVQAQLDAGAAINPFGAIDRGLIAMRATDRARALSNSGDAEAVFNGTLFALPAGDVSTTLRFGADIVDFDTRSTRSGVFRSANLSRRTADGQVNFDLPITSLRNDVLSAIGDLSANLNAAATRYSDFGTLTTIGYGLTWKPRDGVTLLLSHTDDEGAPTIQQLGNPQIATSAIRVFDYLKGTTVDITRIDGGNPDLLANNRHVTRIGFNLKPFEKKDLRITANFTRTKTENQTATLPQPTAAIEAAFPDRFSRDADGTLLRIDNRPVNFAEENREQLRWGFNLSLPLKATPAMIERMRVARERRQAEARARGEADPNVATATARGAGQSEGGPPGGGRPGGERGERQGGNRGAGGFGGFGGPPGGGFGGGGRGGPGGGRVQLALYHTWVFRDDILIRPGLPLLDQLNGAAAGFSGGQPRHALEAQAGFTRLGIGGRINANWQSGTFVRGGGLASGTGGAAGSGTGDLNFGSLTTANARLFFDMAQMPLFQGKGWARGMRVSLGVNNVFNQRLRVTDASGATPLSYQPGYIDPIGRQVQISLRKLLF